MPLGIDRTHYLAEKNKRLEKDCRTKDERIAHLETENAMLYLKMAQLRGQLQSSREDVSGLQTQFEGEGKFQQTVYDAAFKLKQELEQIKRKAAAVQRLAVDLPQQFQMELKHAGSVLQKHKHLFVSQTSSLFSLQDQLTEMHSMLTDVTDRHAKERKRRQEIHNILMVNSRYGLKLGQNFREKSLLPSLPRGRSFISDGEVL